MAFLVGASSPLAVQRLAIPAVCLLIAFLGYGSQYLFAVSPDLDPGPLTTRQKWIFNTLLACLWWTYYKACSVDPGRYTFPPLPKGEKPAKTKNKDGRPAAGSSDDDDEDEDEDEDDHEQGGGGKKGSSRRPPRWCRKCRRPKPPRAHHCKTCARCIPKMDHHCPWTSNCVSLQTFPHFVRFLTFTNVSLWMLLRLLASRFAALWRHRHLPAYLGPTLPQLAWLTVFSLVTALTSLALGVLFATTVKGWLFNTTMIESWEVDRHEAAMARRGGYDREDEFWRPDADERGTNPNMHDLPSDPVEFPYDVGVWRNLGAAMGTSNPLLWFFPLAGHPVVASPPAPSSAPSSFFPYAGVGWSYEENGLNDAEGQWPPADLAKARLARAWRRRRRETDDELRREREWELQQKETAADRGPGARRDAFRARQARDLRRWEGRILGELEEDEELADLGYDLVGDDEGRSGGGGAGSGYGARGPSRPGGRGAVIVDEGKSGWVNADGEHLGDYGVDEDAELDDPEDDEMSSDDDDDDEDEDENEDEDDDVPLGELIRRRKVLSRDGEDT
jgi:palmitoyltransferase